MSKIEELIEKLCPNGVEYKKLEEVCFIETGEQLNKDKLKSEGLYPVMNGGIYASGYWDEYNTDKNTIIISQGGASAGYTQFMTTPFWAGAHCFKVKLKIEEVNYRYLYHFIKNNQDNLMSSQIGAGIPSVSRASLYSLQVPFPPLEVQREIVKILDNFTELTAELTAELTVRQKQYEFYRDELLKFDDVTIHKTKLLDVAEFSQDRLSISKLNKNNYVGVDNLLQNKMGKVESQCVPIEGNHKKFINEDILIGNIRPYLKKIWFADCIGGASGDVLVLRTKNKDILLPKYLYHVLSSDYFFNYNNNTSKGAKMPRGDKEAISKFEFYIPNIAVQKNIINILDKFDTIVNDLKNGLPAEIEARQKQYEYYRDKLLTFKRKK